MIAGLQQVVADALDVRQGAVENRRVQDHAVEFRLATRVDDRRRRRGQRRFRQRLRRVLLRRDVRQRGLRVGAREVDGARKVGDRVAKLR